MSRQIGSVLGVAVLVAVLHDQQAADPLAGFRDGWHFMIIAAASALAIGDVRRHYRPEAPPPRPVLATEGRSG